MHRNQTIASLARASLALLLLFGAFGCNNQRFIGSVTPDYDPALLSGAAVFGTSIAPRSSPTPDLLAKDGNMSAFVNQSIGDRKLKTARFRRLLIDLNAAGYFHRNYAADVSQTAADTFLNKRGNCLSYTGMFVVLARMAGLDARFQVVDMPPAWDADSDYLIRSKHINAVVRGIHPGGDRNLRHSGEYTVDFNQVRASKDFHSEIVSDTYAASLFHANIAVQHLLQGEKAEGFRFLRASIETEPRNPDHWLNLGAFYATHQAPEQARDAFTVALQLAPTNKTANAGIARAYIQLGDNQKAQHHAKRARRYQSKNPYYHFGLAQRALQKDNAASALHAINRALRLSRKNGGFYFVKAIAQQRLGDVKGSKRSLNRARKLGADPRLTNQYRHELPTHALELSLANRQFMLHYARE